MICLFDGVKPVENLVNKIIVGWFIQLYVYYFSIKKKMFHVSVSVKLNFLAFKCKLQSLNFNKYIDSGFNTHVTYILHK